MRSVSVLRERNCRLFRGFLIDNARGRRRIHGIGQPSFERFQKGPTTKSLPDESKEQPRPQNRFSSSVDSDPDHQNGPARVLTSKWNGLNCAGNVSINAGDGAKGRGASAAIAEQRANRQ